MQTLVLEALLVALPAACGRLRHLSLELQRQVEPDAAAALAAACAACTQVGGPRAPPCP